MVKTDEIIWALRLRHPEDRWVFACEVETMTGALGSSPDPSERMRRIDAFAMALWPSLNYMRVAYEIKASRTDWLSEIANPIKRAPAFLLSNEFWFVFTPDIWERSDMNREMLHCGILVFANGALKEEWKATWHPAWPMPDNFLASFLRRVRGKTWAEIYDR